MLSYNKQPFGIKALEELIIFWGRTKTYFQNLSLLKTLLKTKEIVIPLILSILSHWFLPRSDVFHLWFTLPCWTHRRCQSNGIKATINSSQCHIACFIPVCVSIHTVNYPQVRFAAATQVCYCFWKSYSPAFSHAVWNIYSIFKGDTSSPLWKSFSDKVPPVRTCYGSQPYI